MVVLSNQLTAILYQFFRFIAMLNCQIRQLIPVRDESKVYISCFPYPQASYQGEPAQLLSFKNSSAVMTGIVADLKSFKFLVINTSIPFSIAQ